MIYDFQKLCKESPRMYLLNKKAGETPSSDKPERKEITPSPAGRTLCLSPICLSRSSNKAKPTTRGLRQQQIK